MTIIGKVARNAFDAATESSDVWRHPAVGENCAVGLESVVKIAMPGCSPHDKLISPRESHNPPNLSSIRTGLWLWMHSDLKRVTDGWTDGQGHSYVPSNSVGRGQKLLTFAAVGIVWVGWVAAAACVPSACNEPRPITAPAPGPRHWGNGTPRGSRRTGPTFIKPDQLDPWIKDQMKTTLLSTISPLQLPNFVSCGRDKPSHKTQNLGTVGTKIVDSRAFLSWSLIHGSSWSGLIILGLGLS